MHYTPAHYTYLDLNLWYDVQSMKIVQRTSMWRNTPKSPPRLFKGQLLLLLLPSDDQVQSASCSLECDEVGGEAGVGEALGGSRQVIDPQRSVLAFPAKSAHRQSIRQMQHYKTFAFQECRRGKKDTDVYINFTARNNRIYNRVTDPVRPLKGPKLLKQT